MKIEKLSDNQIRCTLTKGDLEQRGIRLSELAYGSEKAKELFRDMMYQASQDFGFEADDMPLMVEAVPMSTERIILIITKVENPDELDTRFSRFTPFGASSQNGQNANVPVTPESADDILDLFEKAREKISEAVSRKTKEQSQSTESLEADGNAAPQAAVLTDITRLYEFPSLSAVMRVAGVVDGFYHGENTLYKSKRDGRYHLFIKKSAHSPQDFNRLCNIFSEYAQQEKCTTSSEAFFSEHGELLIEKNALQTLAEL